MTQEKILEYLEAEKSVLEKEVIEIVAAGRTDEYEQRIYTARGQYDLLSALIEIIARYDKDAFIRMQVDNTIKESEETE